MLSANDRDDYVLQAWWKGRLLKDFVHKKDIMTVNSYISSEASDGETSASKWYGYWSCFILFSRLFAWNEWINE